MQTPWGRSDSKETFGTRGVSFVGTPSHGGFAVADGFARKHLSPAALLRGEHKGGYYFFEEDCDAFIILLELPQTRNQYDERAIIASLSRWHADYLIQRNIEPDPEGLKFFNENRLQDRMRAEKSPELIVSASGDWHADCPKGFVLVTTADDSRWLVKAEEYDTRNTTLTLLSSFTGVKAVA